MITKINATWLRKNTCCIDEQELKLANKTKDVKLICEWLFDRNRVSDACWIISKCMNLKTALKYALYGTKKALLTYEKQSLNKTKATNRIKAIEKYNRNPTKENRQKLKNKCFTAVDYAAAAFYHAADNNYIDYAIIDAATSITIAAFDVFDKKIQKLIINYGLRLLYKDKQ